MSNPADLNPDDLELEMIEIIGAIPKGEALARLEKNPDFQTIILEGYLKQKVLDSVSLLGVPAIKDRNGRPAVVEDLVSASNLQYYFWMTHNDYHTALQDASGELEEDFDTEESEGVIN